jgi:hypothetical protein
MAGPSEPRPRVPPSSGDAKAYPESDPAPAPYWDARPPPPAPVGRRRGVLIINLIIVIVLLLGLALSVAVLGSPPQ